MKTFWVTITLLFNISFASIEEDLAMLSQSEYNLYNDIALSLRCVVCANQTIKSSNAEISIEFKKIIIEQIKDNKKKENIISYFEERYGEKVNYLPSFNLKNFVLWIFPFVILITLLIYFVIQQYKRYPK